MCPAVRALPSLFLGCFSTSDKSAGRAYALQKVDKARLMCVVTQECVPLTRPFPKQDGSSA